MAGHAALMYSTPDGSKTLTAALNYVDDAALSMAEAFQKTTQSLVQAVFGGGQAGAADAAEPAQRQGRAGWTRTGQADSLTLADARRHGTRTTRSAGTPLARRVATGGAIRH
ncbi:hypothetical protein SALBM311S_12200 [Streptomyces alboniger]